MPRQFLNELGERDKVTEIFLVGEKQLRQNRNGDLYLQMRLSDKTGACCAMMWNVSKNEASHIHNGDYVSIEGISQFYNGAIQIIVTQIELADEGSVNEEDFIHVDAAKINGLVDTLCEQLRAMSNPDLVRLAEAFIGDEVFMKKFRRAPAAIKNHHAYHGGLLEHVVKLMRLAKKVAVEYDEVDDDLLLMGAFLHDSGKIDELTYERDLGYSDEGQLIGHLVMGAMLVEKKVDEINNSDGEPFPVELALRLKHMILSHHGKYEFGSPKVPMTLEAIALHYLDDLDAKVQNFRQLMSEDANVDSPWTTYHPNLGRKLFKGAKKE
jgi:3'-5' exoribonuclease